MPRHFIACREGNTKNRENNWSRKNVTCPRCHLSVTSTVASSLTPTREVIVE